MKINDWFDPYDREHLEAYKHLNDTGCWPEGFVPEDMEYPPAHQILIAGKLAACWVYHRLEEKD